MYSVTTSWCLRPSLHTISSARAHFFEHLKSVWLSLCTLHLISSAQTCQGYPSFKPSWLMTTPEDRMPSWYRTSPHPTQLHSAHCSSFDQPNHDLLIKAAIASRSQKSSRVMQQRLTAQKWHLVPPLSLRPSGPDWSNHPFLWISHDTVKSND